MYIAALSGIVTFRFSGNVPFVKLAVVALFHCGVLTSIISNAEYVGRGLARAMISFHKSEMRKKLTR